MIWLSVLAFGQLSFSWWHWHRRTVSSFARLDRREPALSLSGRQSPHQPDYPERGFGQ
jgi:hypothetical protein